MVHIIQQQILKCGDLEYLYHIAFIDDNEIYFYDVRGGNKKENV